jgi:hypothetical protein
MNRKDLVINGYIHPTRINDAVKQNEYKSYNGKSKDLYINSNTNTGYATFTPEKVCECYHYDENGNVIHSNTCTNTIKIPKEYNFISDMSETTKKSEKQVYNQKVDKCPICDEIPLYDCDCDYRDMICKNKHCWYIKKGMIMIGDPHL